MIIIIKTTSDLNYSILFYSPKYYPEWVQTFLVCQSGKCSKTREASQAFPGSVYLPPQPRQGAGRGQSWVLRSPLLGSPGTAATCHYAWHWSQTQTSPLCKSSCFLLLQGHGRMEILSLCYKKKPLWKTSGLANLASYCSELLCVSVIFFHSMLVIIPATHFPLNILFFIQL